MGFLFYAIMLSRPEETWPEKVVMAFRLYGREDATDHVLSVGLQMIHTHLTVTFSIWSILLAALVGVRISTFAGQFGNATLTCS